MDTPTTLLVILLAIGAIQGLIYGIILWNNQTLHRRAYRFLAAILFFFSYRLIAEILHFFGLGRYDTWYYILLEFNWIYGALIYFFAVSYVRPNFRLQPKHWVHFIPVAIEVLWSFFIKSQNFYWDGTRESLTWLGYWGYVVWMHYPTMYVVAGILIVYYSRRAMKVVQQPSETPGYQLIPQNFKWINRVLWCLLIFSIVFTLTTLVDFLFFDYAFNFFGYPIFAVLAIITYWLGLEGFSRRNSEAFKRVDIPSLKETQVLEEIAAQIREQMDEQDLYKNADLSVGSLAETLGVKPYLVTKAFTLVFKTKFTDYINERRFEAVKELLKQPESDKFTLLSLAFEAGFNSKASFNRTVKKITGKSPKHLKSNS